jgi:hypothetical protein
VKFKTFRRDIYLQNDCSNGNCTIMPLKVTDSDWRMTETLNILWNAGDLPILPYNASQQRDFRNIFSEWFLPINRSFVLQITTITTPYRARKLISLSLRLLYKGKLLGYSVLYTYFPCAIGTNALVTVYIRFNKDFVQVFWYGYITHIPVLNGTYL